MIIDLHVHTNKSDGRKPYDEILKEATTKGITKLAITDHDVIHYSTQHNSLDIISGIELSAIYKGGLFHILGYHFNNNQALATAANKNLIAQANHSNYRDELFIKAYAKVFDFDSNDYNAYPGGAEPIPGKQFISKVHNYLFDKQICTSHREFFTDIIPKVFTEKVDWGMPDFIDLESAIKAIQQSGGFAILAHPFSPKQKLPLMESLKLLTEMGIDGFECIHTDISKEGQQTCLEWCKDKNMFITGGSDYHGGRHKRTLGLSIEECRMINMPL